MSVHVNERGTIKEVAISTPYSKIHTAALASGSYDGNSTNVYTTFPIKITIAIAYAFGSGSKGSAIVGAVYSSSIINTEISGSRYDGVKYLKIKYTSTKSLEVNWAANSYSCEVWPVVLCLG